MKRKLARAAIAAGVLALGWLLDINGIRSGANAPRPEALESPAPAAAVAAVPAPAADVAAEAATATPAQHATAATPATAAAPATAATPARPSSAAQAAYRPARAAAAEVVRDGEYCGKAEVAAYLRRFGGRLPRNFITKAQARELGWQGGPLEPYAPGKSIGGDHFGNYERKLPDARYRECDIDTRGRPRGGKRLIYTTDGRTIYYTADHYETFEPVPEDAP